MKKEILEMVDNYQNGFITPMELLLIMVRMNITTTINLQGGFVIVQMVISNGMIFLITIKTETKPLRHITQMVHFIKNLKTIFLVFKELF